MKKTTDFTLILPCFNESEHIKESVKTIIDSLRNLPYTWEIIFIDDKSTDDTIDYLKTFINEKNNIRIFFHRENKGRGATVKEGIMHARSAIVGYMDIDCEISPRYIETFINKVQEGYDIVSAHRYYRFSLVRLVRYITSKTYTIILHILFSLDFPDTEAGYKFFRKSAILPVLNLVQSDHWFWDTEILMRSKQKGLKIAFVPAEFIRKHDKNTTVELIPDTIDYIKNLWKLKRETYESDS